MKFKSNKQELLNSFDVIKTNVDIHAETLLSNKQVQTEYSTEINEIRNKLIEHINAILHDNVSKLKKCNKFCVFIPNDDLKNLKFGNKLGKLIILNENIKDNVISHLRLFLNKEPPSQDNWAEYFGTLEEQITTMFLMELILNRNKTETIIDLSDIVENRLEKFQVDAKNHKIDENWFQSFNTRNFNPPKVLELKNFVNIHKNFWLYENLNVLKFSSLSLDKDFDVNLLGLRNLEVLEIILNPKRPVGIVKTVFQELKNLKSLTLKFFVLKELDFLTDNLDHLDLSNSSLKSFISPKLKNLKILNLENNEIVSLKIDLDQLEYLNLSGCPLERVSLSLKKLEYLNLGKYYTVNIDTFELPQLKFLILNTKTLSSLKSLSLQRLEVYGLETFEMNGQYNLDYLSLSFCREQCFANFNKKKFHGLNGLKFFRLNFKFEQNDQISNGFIKIFDELVDGKEQRKTVFYRDRSFLIQISKIESESDYVINVLKVSNVIKEILLKKI